MVFIFKNILRKMSKVSKVFPQVFIPPNFVQRKIIIDTDGGVDDGWSISVLAKVEVEGKTNEILGITCVKGNTTVENASNNVLHLLSVIRRTDIPVFNGAQYSLLNNDEDIEDPNLKYFHGKNGFGDVELDKPSNMPCLQKENAIEALNRIASENKGELTIVCIGPLTNIALAIRTYPDFVENVKEVFIMGGNIKAVGNTTKVGEFNFWADPEAAFIVIKELASKIVILPWETCVESQLTFDSRYKLGENAGPIVSFLNKIETPIINRMKYLGFPSYVTADQLLAAAIVHPSIIKYAFKASAVVERAGHHTRGLLILDWVQQTKNYVTFIKRIDTEEYFNVLLSLKTL